MALAESPDIGEELIAAREEKVPWKLLERRYNLRRTRLNEVWREARAKRRAAAMPPLRLHTDEPGLLSSRMYGEHIVD